MTAVVGVIMGSRSDWETMRHACETLAALDIPFEQQVVSAHRTPDLLFEYAGSAERLRDVWIAVRANLRAVLEQVTIADLASGDLPLSVEELTSNPDAWQPH